MSATLNGNMASDGGVTITEKGFVYSTSNTNPEINGGNANRETVIGTETGGFSKDITGLTAGTVYYYKAYVTNVTGTTYYYGDAQDFMTFAVGGTASNEELKAGVLNITTVKKTDYRLLNIRGQVLKKGTLDAGKKNKLDISSLAKSVYLLNLKTSKGGFTKKVIKN